MLTFNLLCWRNDESLLRVKNWRQFYAINTSVVIIILFCTIIFHLVYKHKLALLRTDNAILTTSLEDLPAAKNFKSSEIIAPLPKNYLDAVQGLLLLLHNKQLSALSVSVQSDGEVMLQGKTLSLFALNEFMKSLWVQKYLASFNLFSFTVKERVYYFSCKGKFK